MNTRNRKIILLTFFIAVCMTAKAQHEGSGTDVAKQSFIYTIKGTDSLGLDVYGGKFRNGRRPCIVFIFGGAFIGGKRDDSIYHHYFEALINKDYIVVSIAYRLGLKGVQKLSKWNTTPLQKAVVMAIEDVYDATHWVLQNAEKLGIDTNRIVLSGSSSGAITALSADYQLRNGLLPSRSLPAKFQYAGVIAFSGAIFTTSGKLHYQISPAPVLLFHGSGDKIVPYDKIRFFNKGLYGSSSIAGVLKKGGYPFYIYRAITLGHEVSVSPMYYQLPLIIDFLAQWVVNQKRLQVDESFFDPDLTPQVTLTTRQLLKKLQRKD